MCLFYLVFIGEVRFTYNIDLSKAGKSKNLELVIKLIIYFLCSYLAPEYFMYGKVNDKIDVYAFGVVLLELLSGRKPISSDYPKGQESLVMWVCSLY